MNGPAAHRSLSPALLPKLRPSNLASSSTGPSKDGCPISAFHQPALRNKDAPLKFYKQLSCASSVHGSGMSNKFYEFTNPKPNLILYVYSMELQPHSSSSHDLTQYNNIFEDIVFETGICSRKCIILYLWLHVCLQRRYRVLCPG